MEGRSALREFGILALATLVGTLVLAGSWILPDAGTAVSPDLEDPTFVMWTLGWDLRQLARDPGNLFEANVSWPARGMLARTETMLGCVPSFALSRGLGAGPVAAYNLTLLVSFWLSALAMAWLVRRGTGDLAASALVGLAYALAPLHLSEIGRLQLQQGMWFPLVLLAWEALRERPGPRAAAVLGLALAGTFLSCIYFFLQLLVGAPLYGVLSLRGEARPGRVLAWAAVAGLLAGVVLLPVLLPYYRMLHRWPQDRVLTFNAYHAAEPRDFLSVPPENRAWGPWLAGFSSMRAQRATALFPGVLLLLGAGVAAARRCPRTGALLAVAALAAVLALGPAFSPFGLPSPYRLLHEHMPGFSAHRVPARFGFLMIFALAAAAGPGVAFLRARGGRPALVALLALALADAFTPMPRAAVPPLPEIYRDLAGQAPGVVLEVPMFPDLQPSPSLEGLRHFYSGHHGQTLVNGYPLVTPPVTHEVADLVAAGPTAQAVQGMQLLGVRYLVVHAEQFPPARRGEWEGLAADGFRLLARRGGDSLWQVPAGALRAGGMESARWSLQVPPAWPAGVTLTAGLGVQGGAVHAYRPDPGMEPLRVRWEGPGVQEQTVRTLLPTWVFPGERQLRQIRLRAPRVPGVYQLSVAGAGWSASAPVEVREEALTFGLPWRVAVAWADLPAQVEPGASLRLEGMMRNLGTEALQAGSLTALPQETWLYVRWVGEAGPGALERRPLRLDLLPGQEAPWLATTRAPGTPGPWRLEIVFASGGGPGPDAPWLGRVLEVRP